jgi:hypothetical protein
MLLAAVSPCVRAEHTAFVLFSASNSNVMLRRQAIREARDRFKALMTRYALPSVPY